MAGRCGIQGWHWDALESVLTSMLGAVTPGAFLYRFWTLHVLLHVVLRRVTVARTVDPNPEDTPSRGGESGRGSPSASRTGSAASRGGRTTLRGTAGRGGIKRRGGARVGRQKTRHRTSVADIEKFVRYLDKRYGLILQHPVADSSELLFVVPLLRAHTAAEYFPAVAAELYGARADGCFIDSTSNVAESFFKQAKTHVLGGSAGSLCELHDACLYLAKKGSDTVQFWQDAGAQTMALLRCAPSHLNAFHAGQLAEERDFQAQLQVGQCWS